jgi:hypothetical protein
MGDLVYWRNPLFLANYLLDADRYPEQIQLFVVGQDSMNPILAVTSGQVPDVRVPYQSLEGAFSLDPGSICET